MTDDGTLGANILLLIIGGAGFVTLFVAMTASQPFLLRAAGVVLGATLIILSALAGIGAFVGNFGTDS